MSSDCIELLPTLCYAVIDSHPAGKRIVAIRRGETGFYTTTLDHAGQSLDDCRKLVDLYNAKLDVRPLEVLAMLHGSMFGFDTPGASLKVQQRDQMAAQEPRS